MIITTEKNRQFTFDVTHFGNKDMHELYIINPNTYEKMGCINFRQENDKFWIYILQIYEKHQNKGIGYALLNCLEFLAYLKDIKVIQGKFCPRNEFAKPLYDKCGYLMDTEKKSYPIIYKTINKNEIENKILPNIHNGNTAKQETEMEM